MATLLIEDSELVGRLTEIARREDRTVEAVIRSLLASHPTGENGATFDALYRSALAANIAGDKPLDTSSNAKQILRGQYKPNA